MTKLTALFESRLLACLGGLILVLGSFIYLFAPISWDARMFFAATQLAHHQYGGGLSGVLNSWELKPFGNRAFDYLIYRCATLFVDFDNKPQFEFAVRAVYLSFIYACSVFSAPRISAFLKREGVVVSRGLIFFLISSAFIWTSFMMTFEVEEKTVLLSVVAFACLSSKRWPESLVAGFLLAWVVLLKGLTLVMVAEVLLLFLPVFKEYRRSLLIGGIAFAAAGVASLVTVIWLYPQLLVDVNDARQMQNGFQDTGLRALVYHAFRIDSYFSENLLLLSGWCSFLVLCFTSKSVKKTIWLISFWVLSLLPVWIQGWGFPYHYLIVLFPSLIFTVLVLGQSEWSSRRLIALMLGISLCLGLSFFLAMFQRPDLMLVKLFLVWMLIALGSAVYAVKRGWLNPAKQGSLLVFMNLGFSILLFCFFQTSIAAPLGLENFRGRWARQASLWTKWEHQRDSGEVMKGAAFLRQIIPSRDIPILYLDELYCYYLGNPSSYRYFFPLPIHRAWNFPRLLQSEVYLKTKAAIEGFDGKYVVVTDSRYAAALPQLFERFARDYREVVFDPKLKVYIRN